MPTAAIAIDNPHFVFDKIFDFLRFLYKFQVAMTKFAMAEMILPSRLHCPTFLIQTNKGLLRCPIIISGQIQLPPEKHRESRAIPRILGEAPTRFKETEVLGFCTIFGLLQKCKSSKHFQILVRWEFVRWAGPGYSLA